MSDFVDLIDKGLFIKKYYNNWPEYIEDTSKVLFEADYTIEGFSDALIERETLYPTGLILDGNSFNVAMPHGEFKYIKKEAIIVNVFEKPILFNKMDEPDEQIEVKISFMLLLKEAGSHLNTLKDLMQLFRNYETLKIIIECDNKQDLMKLFSDSVSKTYIET